MLKTDIDENEMVDFFLQGLELTDELDELEKIRIAKKILRIHNGVPLKDEEAARRTEERKDGLKINERYYVNATLRDSPRQAPMRLYGHLGIKKMKLAASSDKLKRSEFADLQPVRKQLTFEPARECDLELEDIMKGDIKLEKEPKLVFLRFFGKADNINLRGYNDSYFNSIDFLAKDKAMIPRIDSLQSQKYYQTHYYQKNKRSDIRFYSDFMGGNLWKVYETAPDTFDVYTNVETNNSLLNYWFFFKVVYAGHKETKQVVVNIKSIELGISDEDMNIWVKHKANGISNYSKARNPRRKKRQQSKADGAVHQENMKAFDGWDNNLKARIVRSGEHGSSGLRFVLTLKKNEDCYVALSYPYFMNSFFTELKLHSHPLFSTAEFRRSKARHDRNSLV